MLMIVAIFSSVTGSFLVASKQKHIRFWGFMGFMLSNVIWVSRGMHTGDPWILLQFGAFMLSAGIGLANNCNR